MGTACLLPSIWLRGPDLGVAVLTEQLKVRVFMLKYPVSQAAFLNTDDLY